MTRAAVRKNDPGLCDHVRANTTPNWGPLKPIPPDHGIVIIPGNKFIGGDWSSIEARLVLAFARQRDKLALMASGADVYCDMASTIYHEPVTKADVERRQVGKNTVLGCGFGMGFKKFRERYCPKEPAAFAREVVYAYRESWAPGVPKLWAALGDAALSAVRGESGESGYGVTYRHVDINGQGALVAECLDGSRIYYPNPTLGRRRRSKHVINDAGEIVTVESDRWDDAWRYQVPQGKTNEERTGPSGSWVWAYGGLLTENFIQHMARQCLCGALVECKRRGLDVVLHNQDEILLEVPDWQADDPKILQEVMEITPTWLTPYAVDPEGNPLQLLAAECWVGDRYRKS